MNRPNPSKPDSRNPQDFIAAGYSESSATSEAYRGTVPDLDLSDQLARAKNRLTELLGDEDPEVALSAIKVVFQNHRLGRAKEDQPVSDLEQAESDAVKKEMEEDTVACRTFNSSCGSIHVTSTGLGELMTPLDEPER